MFCRGPAHHVDHHEGWICRDAAEFRGEEGMVVLLGSVMHDSV